MTLTAQNAVIDTRGGNGNNNSDNYVTYDKAITVAAGKAVDVQLARYCYITSTVSGKGTINLYAGGERCYLGTKNGSSWANWTNFKGDAHIYPFKENSSSAGFYGIVLAHGGKTFLPGNIEESINSGKLNNAMQNCKVTVHKGAVLCNEANSTNAGGFRLGELEMEEGSTLRGYMKDNRTSYYLVGNLNGDATLAGTIAPGKDATILGLIKEGTGTYRITGNKNNLTGALRIVGGRLLVNNDRAEAESKKLNGGTGAKSNENEAIVFVFGKGILGGTGSIGGSVDNYGTIEPGDETPGTLTLKNYVTTTKNAHLTVHPASVLRFKVASADSYDQLAVAGNVKYSTTTEDFQTSNAQPVIAIAALSGFAAEVGTELTLLTAKAKTGDWTFRLQKPDKGTWTLEEITDGNGYKVVARLVSLEDSDDPDDPENPEDPEIPESTMGAFYDDGIADASDSHTLRYYAEKNDKKIGIAMSTYKGLDNERDECGRQFNMLVAENEMKMEVLQPSQGSFSWGGADQLVSHAQKHNMAVRGHCLVWHSQQPEWLSGDKGKKNDKNWTRQQALNIMKTHITTVMKHFKGKVTEWDVVNECLDDDQSIVFSNPDGYKLRPSVWQLAIGDDYIDSAFVYARQADPSVVLYLNDYGVEQQGQAKAVAFRNLAKRLQQRNIPIDGVGLQCHFTIGQVDSVKLARTFSSFTEDGLKCVITELDMGIPSTTSANLEEQARLYRVITDIVLNNDNCPYMVIWGAKDNDSWRSSSSPLLYDSGLGKKKAWYAVRSALRHRALLKEQTDIADIHQSPSTINHSPSTIHHSPSTETYDLQGRRVKGNTLRPGLYIQNGKKVFINPLNQ